MSLPRGARREWIVVLRTEPDPGDPDAVPDPIAPAETSWGRVVRVDVAGPDAEHPGEVLRTIGELQPVKLRGGSGEVVTVTSDGPAISTHVAFTDVLDIRTGDTLRTAPLADIDTDDGLRYNVQRISRIGKGRRLEHLEVYCELVTRGVP